MIEFWVGGLFMSRGAFGVAIRLRTVSTVELLSRSMHGLVPAEIPPGLESLVAQSADYRVLSGWSFLASSRCASCSSILVGTSLGHFVL